MQKNVSDYNEAAYWRYSLLIRGDSIDDMEEIITRLSFPNYKIVRKGDIISKVGGPARLDVYKYQIECEESEELFNQNFREFLLALKPHAEYLRLLSKKYEVRIRLFLQSLLAQMYFELSQENIELLSEIGIVCAFSILSWGGVEDN